MGIVGRKTGQVQNWFSRPNVYRTEVTTAGDVALGADEVEDLPVFELSGDDRGHHVVRASLLPETTITLPAPLVGDLSNICGLMLLRDMRQPARLGEVIPGAGNQEILVSTETVSYPAGPTWYAHHTPIAVLALVIQGRLSYAVDLVPSGLYRVLFISGSSGGYADVPFTILLQTT